MILEGDVLGILVLSCEIGFSLSEAQEAVDLWLRDAQGEVGAAATVGICVTAYIAGLDIAAECGRLTLNILYEGIEIGSLEAEIDVSDELTGIRNLRGIDRTVGAGAVCAGIAAFLQRNAVHFHIRCAVVVGDGLFC